MTERILSKAWEAVIQRDCKATDLLNNDDDDDDDDGGGNNNNNNFDIIRQNKANKNNVGHSNIY